MFTSKNSISQTIVFLSSGAKQVKVCRNLTAVNQSKILKVGKLRNNSTFFDFSEICENLKKLKRFLNLTFSRLAQIWKKLKKIDATA